MTDVLPESSFPPNALRRFIDTWYRCGPNAPLFVEYLLGLTEREQDEFMAGNDAVWLAKKTPERLQRFETIMTQLHKAWRQYHAEQVRNMSAHDYESWSRPFLIVLDRGIAPTDNVARRCDSEPDA